MTVMALVGPFLIALVLSLLCGGKVIAALAAAKARQPVSDDAPEAHKIKHGTPTMGGLLILGASLAAVAGSYLIPGVAQSTRNSLWLVALTFVLACGVGLADDIGKARKKLNKAGLSERAKLALQILVAVLFVGGTALSAEPGVTTAITLGITFDLGIVYYALALLYICFFGNAVNFTDGLDGLSSGVTLIVCLALGTAAFITGDPHALAIVPFYGAIAGACAGFLKFNRHPAKVFMGDTGSLALGMGLAAAALAAKQEILLLIVGMVYVAEIFSMMIQRYVFKYRRIKFGIEYAKANRVFRRAPLHHHFEELGWHETKVVQRFYIAALIAAIVGVAVAKGLAVGVPSPPGRPLGTPSPIGMGEGGVGLSRNAHGFGFASDFIAPPSPIPMGEGVPRGRPGGEGNTPC